MKTTMNRTFGSDKKSLVVAIFLGAILASILSGALFLWIINSLL